MIYPVKEGKGPRPSHLSMIQKTMGSFSVFLPCRRG